MTKKEMMALYDGLSEFMRGHCPCYGGACVGHQNCEVGENGAYDEGCAIEDVQQVIYMTMRSQKGDK